MKWGLLLLMACVHAVPSRDSPAFTKCAARCPDGAAFIFENAVDVACFCRKPPEGT